MGTNPKTQRGLVPEAAPALPAVPAGADVSAVGRVHDAVGNLEVRDVLGDTSESPEAIRESVRHATAGIESRGHYESNSAMLRAMRRGSAPARPVEIEENGGSPLPEPERGRMEQAFGRSFGHVRVHTDGNAAQAAVDLQAHAFALGSHVFFGPGEWSPGSQSTERLLAHELTHVVQHDEGRIPAVTGDHDEVSSPDDPLEREAYANEQVILDRLEADPSDDEVPDEIAARLPTHTLVDGRAAAQAAEADAQLVDMAEELGAGPFLLDRAPAMSVPDVDAELEDFQLRWLGQRIDQIDIRDLLGLPKPNEKVFKKIYYSPCKGVEFTGVHVHFDVGGLPKKVELDVTLTVENWVQQSSRLGVDKDGNISAKITGIWVNIPGLFKALANISFSIEGISIDCDVDWPDFDFNFGSWGGGRKKKGGGLFKWIKAKWPFHWDGLKGPSGGGLLIGEIPTIGTIEWDMKLDGFKPSGFVKLAVFAPLTPLPGLRIDEASLTGSYNEGSLLLTGLIAVTVADKFKGKASCTYDVLEQTWSLDGELPQLEPIKVGNWELTEAKIGLLVERGTFLASQAKGLLNTESLKGNFDGHIDIPNFEFTGGGHVSLKKELIKFGAGGLIDKVDAGIEVVKNDLVAISGKMEATLPWNGSPALRITTDNGRLDLNEMALTGDVTITAMRELSIGPEGGTRLLVAQGSSCATHIERNSVTQAQGGMAFKVVDPHGEIGVGQISLGFSAAGSLDAHAQFGLKRDFGFPDFELGPAFLKEGGHFEVEVANSQITLIKLVNVGFALMSGSKEDGLGMIEGTVAGTWDGKKSLIEQGTISAKVNNAFHIPLPYGKVVLEPGGTVTATVTAGALSALELHVPAHANINSKRFSLGVKGRYDGTWDSKAGGMSGEAAAQLTDPLTVVMANGNRVVVHAENSDFHIKFEPEGVTYVRFSAAVTYYRGGQPFVSGGVENATWDNGDISFGAILHLHDEFTRDLKGGRKLTIKKDSEVEVHVEKNALTKIGGSVHFLVSDKEPLFEGDFTDVLIDVDKLEFSGGWSGKTKRALTWPKQESKDPAAGNLRLVIAEGAGTSGRIEKNELKRVKANIDFKAKLLDVELGEGQAEFDWDLANDLFSGKGHVKLKENFPLSPKSRQKGSSQKPQDWDVWVVKDSELAVDLKKNVLQEGKVKAQIVAADPKGTVLAGGEIDGQYKIGDPLGYHGKIHAEVKQEFPWYQGDRFTWTALPKSFFDANISNSTIQDAAGNVDMRGREGTADKVVVKGKGDYNAKNGFTGNGSIDVVSPIEFLGDEYKIELTKSNAAKARVVKDDLAEVDGNAEVYVAKDADKFLHGTGTAKYKGGKDAKASGKVSLEVLHPIDLGARSDKYRVELQQGAGGTINVQDSKLVSVDGIIPIAIFDKKEQLPLVTAQIDGHYRHQEKLFTGTGEGDIGRRIELGKVGKKGWTFFLETTSHGLASVRDNNLQQIDGRLVITVQDGARPILELTGSGKYSGEGSKMDIAEAGVKILDKIEIFKGDKGFVVFLRKDGFARAKLGPGGIEDFHGKISIAVEKDAEPFADVELKGDYTEKEGFTGDGKATVHQSMMAHIGAYDLVIDKSLTQWIAEAKLQGGKVTSIGGTVNFRMDKEGQIELDGAGKPAFLTGTITGHYDVEGGNFSGKGTARIGVPTRLVGGEKKGGEELWLMAGDANVDVQRNILQRVGGNIHMQMRDGEGPYLDVAFTDGSFDAVGGTGFSGKGTVSVTREKKLFGRGAYEFWLDPTQDKGEATANIVQNTVTEVGGTVPFLVKTDSEPFIRGAVKGTYKHGKVTGDGVVELARPVVWKVGSKGRISVEKGSGGGGHVEDSKLERLTGRFTATYSPGGPDLMKLDGGGEYDVLNNKLVKLKAVLDMLRPVELLGEEGKPGTGLIVVSGIHGDALLENNALVSAGGKGTVSVPSLKASGSFEVGWRNTGDGEKYWANGDLNFPLIDNPGKKRKGRIDKLKVALEESGKLYGAVKMAYEMSELIGGAVDVVVHEDLDPEVSGSFVSTGKLARGATLFGFELPTIEAKRIDLGYGFGLGFGAKAGMSLSMRDLTYTVPVSVGPWRPLSSGLEVPAFEAGLDLNWGFDFAAAAAAWLNFSWGLEGLGEVGVGIKGLANLKAGASITPSGKIWGDGGSFGGAVSIALGIHPSLILKAIPYIYAKLPLLDKPLEHEFSDLGEVDLSSALGFDWSSTVEFGDTQRKLPGPTPPPAETPNTPPNKEEVTEEPNTGIKKAQGDDLGQEPGGPDLAGASGASDQEKKAGGSGMGSKFDEIKETMETVEIIGKGIAGLAYLIDMIKDLISAWRFGLVGFIVVLVWKLVTRKLTWTKLKTAALDVAAAMERVVKIIAANLPSMLEGLLEVLSGDKPGLYDALFGADDRMREAVYKGDADYAPLEMRVKMIEELADGYNSEDDEECMAIVAETSEYKHGDFVNLAYQLGPGWLMDQVDGEDDARIAKLMRAHNIEYSTGW